MKISIIVPVYNAEKSIHKCIDSILNQNYKDYEIILIDDGSTDKSGMICDEYTMKDLRVSAVHIRRNEGLSNAIKTGIKKAQGDLITIVDSDDFLDRFYLERMHNAFVMNNADMVFCDYVKHDGTRNIRTHLSLLESGKYEKERIQKEVIPKMLNTSLNTYSPVISTKHWAKVFKAELLKSALRIYSRHSINDISDLITVSVLLNSERVVYLKNEYLYYYRLSPILFETQFYENKITYYNNLYTILSKKTDLDKEFYYFKINIITDSLLHLTNYVETISKRRIINKIKEIKESSFYKELNISKLNPLNNKQKIYLFLLKHNMLRTIYYILRYISKKKKY
ncbi:MAG: glycosyltransferase family 2 protein [Ruminococcaceae bacterium]|nr:glycosyltransferase family 2 protein [Oscillospiraceae bacterium]